MGLPIAELEGKYEIVAKLKEGGMGAIYKVRHRFLDELRVIKVLRPQHADDDELRVRLEREARAAIHLRHPNVVQIFDFSHDETGGLIVMEYIHGSDLTYLVKEPRRPSLALTLEIARQGLRALGFLHRQGYVHRDVSPDNLMLTLDVDERPLIKLIDLGIAKSHSADQDLTLSGSFLGKFRYASPEHFGGGGGAAGSDGTEARSDLYTFGLVLYELITGHYPMDGDSTSQLIAAHLFNEPIPFDRSDPDGNVPSPVRDMLIKSLAKAADDRFQDARSWIDEIELLQEDHPLSPDDLSLAKSLARPPAGWARSVSGDTQSRLSKHLGSSGRPGAAGGDSMAGSSRPVPTVGVADAGAASRAALDVLLTGAEALFQLGRRDQALQQAATILGMDAEHAGALRLRQRILAAAGPDSPSEATDAVPPPVFSAGSSAGGPDTVVSPMPATGIRLFEDLLAAGRIEEAHEQLERLGHSHGEQPPLADMRRRYEERWAEHIANVVRGLLSEAGELVDEGDYTSALDRLRQAQAETPTEGPLHDELTRGVLSIQRRIEKRERRRQLERLEQKVLKLLRHGKLREATAELSKAEDTFGDQDVFKSLRQILDRAVRERQNELGGKAGRALETGSYDTAIRCLSDMLVLDPDNGWIRDQLGRSRQLKSEAEAEEARHRHEQEERRIDFENLAAMITRDELQEAGHMLEILTRRWGSKPSDPWREKLDEQRRAAAHRLLSEAESSRESGDLFKARLLVAEAGRLDPDDTAIGHFATMLDSAAQETVVGSPVPLDDQSVMLHTIAEIERLRVEKEPLKAWKALQQAIEHFGERLELTDLRKELAEQILEESNGVLDV